MKPRLQNVRTARTGLLMSAACCLAGALPSSASVVVFNLNPGLSYQVGGSSYVNRTDQVRSIDLGTGIYSTLASGNGFTVAMTNSPSGMVPGPFGPMLVPGSYEISLRPGTDTEIMMANGTSGPIAYQYASGSMIEAGSFSQLTYNQYGTTSASWAASTNNYLSKSGAFATGFWPSNGTDYVGLRIKAGADDYHYGWLEVTRNVTTSPHTYTITRFAVEDTANTPILAGSLASVPEPSVAVLGSLWGLAFLWIRRRIG